MIQSNPISYAISKIMSIGIDKTILELSYGGVNSIGVKRNISIELDKVLSKYVCNDFNLISGDTIDIPISKCKLIPSSDGRVYYVPPEARRNVDIREVYSIRQKANITHTGITSYGLPMGGSSIVNGLTSMMNAIDNPQVIGNTYIELEDDNTIRVTSADTNISMYDVFVVEIENRDRLRKIKRGSYPLFAKIATAYIKAHIYSNRININKAAIYGGHELSEVSSVISEFSGAQEEYDNYISEDAGKLLIFADEAKLNSLYSNIVI